jgi:hypothetical protein
MNTQATGNVVALKSSVTTQENAIPLELNNVYGITKFVQGEIRASKMKYVEIAKKAQCSPQTVGRLADGTTKDPRIGTVIKILFVLGRRISIV